MTQQSRRQFSQGLLQAIMYGGLVHFAVLDFARSATSIPEPDYDCPGGRNPQDTCEPVSKGVRETDFCPGGGPEEDICNPGQKYYDSCPGEMAPQDECPEDGARGTGYFTLDECASARQDADVCMPSEILGGTASDQCQSGRDLEDLCEESEASLRLDVCPSGISPEPDKCTRDGGEKDGDYCPGGGAAVDFCAENQAGDECANEGDENSDPDQCKAEGPNDECLLSADVCYDGTDTDFGNSGTDICLTIDLGLVQGEGSDQCIDGASLQDKCGVPNYPAENDVCLIGESGEAGDVCAPPLSSDECYGVFPQADECNVDMKDKDECPEGAASADVCAIGLLPEDECPAGCSGPDECNPEFSGSDEPCSQDEGDECGTSDTCSSSDSCSENRSRTDSCLQEDACGEDDSCKQRDFVE